MRVLLIILTLMLSISSAYARCRTTVGGRTVCDNGDSVGGYNGIRGNGWQSQTNQNGVTTTQTRRGGELKTNNGNAVYTSPNGKRCYKSANGQGCN
jgi:hypothetical protein